MSVVRRRPSASVGRAGVHAAAATAVARVRAPAVTEAAATQGEAAGRAKVGAWAVALPGHWSPSSLPDWRNSDYAGPCKTGDTGVLYNHPVRSIAGFAITVAAALVVLVMMLRARPRPSAGARPAFMIATFRLILLNVGLEVLTPVLLQIAPCE